MREAIKEIPVSTQDALLRLLLRHKAGLTVDSLAESLGITRTAVRQHLAAMERDGMVARGPTQPTGGRPEQLYILTAGGRELFPRQYSWFAELLLTGLQERAGAVGTLESLEAMGRQVGAGLRGQLTGADGSPEQLGGIARSMTGLGYDAAARTENGETFIEAHNCVFHRLAEKNPDVCGFDLALLSESTGCKVEHRACMVRGGSACRFHFMPGKTGK